jgi:ABC-2 type transport system permease protein
MSDVLTSDVLTRPSVGRDAVTMAGRCLRLSRRNFESLLMSVMLPVMLMLVFVYLFGGAIQTGTSYITYVVPGVILLCAGYGSAQTAVSVSQDLAGGTIDRFRSMDIGGLPVLVGHVVASVARNIVSTVIVLGVAFLIGFRPGAGPREWLATVGILLLYVLAISALSAAIGLLARTPDAANGFTFVVMFLPYASSAFVPVRTMPSWLHGFANNQPVTPVIESIRGLLLNTPVGDSPGRAVAWCAGILLVSLAGSTLLFRWRTG